MKDKACGNQAVGGYGEGNKAVNKWTGSLEERAEGDFWACIIPEGQKKKEKKGWQRYKHHKDFMFVRF